MPQKVPPRPRKRPQQSRSQMTVDAIQQACLQILRNEGAERLTTQRIADVAGVNIASLYQYFPGKEAILSEVYDALLEELADNARRRFRDIQALSSNSVRDTLAAIIALECEQLLALQKLDPEFFREYQHSFDIHQRVNTLTQSLNNPSWEEWLEDWLLSKHCRGTPALRSVLVRQTLRGNLCQALSEEPALLADPNYREELLQLLLAYLTGENR